MLRRRQATLFFPAAPPTPPRELVPTPAPLSAPPPDLSQRSGLDPRPLPFSSSSPARLPTTAAALAATTRPVAVLGARAGYGAQLRALHTAPAYREVEKSRALVDPCLQLTLTVSSANPDVVYFNLHHRLFCVNVPERRVVDDEANQHELVNVAEAPLPQTGSSRYLLTWNLLHLGRGNNYTFCLRMKQQFTGCFEYLI